MTKQQLTDYLAESIKVLFKKHFAVSRNRVLVIPHLSKRNRPKASKSVKADIVVKHQGIDIAIIQVREKPIDKKFIPVRYYKTQAMNMPFEFMEGPNDLDRIMWFLDGIAKKLI